MAGMKKSSDPTAIARGDGRHGRPGIRQASSTTICVVRKSLILQKRGFDDSSSPSAKTT
jgi:hypothetical protein